jgi:DNA-directed RNA polymerase specialized sigma24 family protein
MGVITLIDEATKLSTWEALAMEAMGGEEVARALWLHHAEGYSTLALSRMLDQPETTLRRQMTKARARMRRLGIMPKVWEQSAVLCASN